MKYTEQEVNLLVTLVIILLGGAAVMMIWMMRKLSKNQVLHELQERHLALEHEKGLMAAKLEMQEFTFQQIAFELHDNIKLSLTLSRLHLYNIDEADENERKEKVQASIEHIEKAIGDVDNISHSLNSDWIRGLGLITVLKNEIDKLRRIDLYTIETFYPEDYVEIDPDCELLIFRIAQESFNNIIKHAAAKKITFSLQYNNDHIYLTIADDGKGFDYNAPGTKTSGTGMNNIRLRAKVLNAPLTIDTAPGKGTTISIKIPYDTKYTDNQNSKI
jgi:two-component system NarL family sensor kinase